MRERKLRQQKAGLSADRRFNRQYAASSTNGRNAKAAAQHGKHLRTAGMGRECQRLGCHLG